MNNRLKKNAGFCVWDLCKELEWRFSKEQPMTTPELMAYFSIFHLHGCDTDHAWIFFLDKKYRFCKEQMFLPKVVANRQCAEYIDSNAHAYSYFFISFVSDDLVLDEIQHRIHCAYSYSFDENPGYLGMILVTNTMDYKYLPPNTER